MSKCISSYGEYSEHTEVGAGDGVCGYCGEVDLDALIAAAEKRGAVKAAEVMRTALYRHPKACDQYDPDDVISCGWKAAVADLEHTLDHLEGDHHAEG